MKSLKITRTPFGVFGVGKRSLIFIFLYIGLQYNLHNNYSKDNNINYKNGWGLFVQGKEAQKLSKVDRVRAAKYPDTARLPRYPVPGMRYDDSESSSGSGVERSKKSRHTSKSYESATSKESGKDDGGDSAGVGVKLDRTKKKKRKSSGSKKIDIGIQVDLDKKKSEHKTGAKKKSKKSSSSSTSSLSSSHSLKSIETMKELLSFVPGVKDYIWQDPKERRTYRNLNPYHGKYFPKIATSPFRKTSECASLFSSAKNAYENREIRITPSQFVGLALPFARRLSDILGQFVNIQDSCLMLRILLHIYSGMRTRTQFVNIIGAVLQNDVILGRMEDRNGILDRVRDLTNYFLQLPRHRADNKSKQMSAIEISNFFHLSVYPKDNSFESRLLPIYREKGEILKERIEGKMGIVIARDEVMSMIYIILNLLEEERTIEQCSEIVSTVIGITHYEPLTHSQREELEGICMDVIGCSERGPIVLGKESIIDVFGPGSAIVEMRQMDIKGLPISSKMRIWKEIGTLDYLGRVVSVLFNDCNGLKANQLNRLCSMMEVMNQRLIKTGTVRDLITIEELCGAHRYRNKHPGIKWSIAIKATLQERHKNIPVKVESLFSHFIKHERQKLAPLEGTVKQKREVFYSVPEFPAPSYLETVTPKSLALGIPTRESHKQEVFYAFNTQPNWVQNRFIFAAAFVEECLMRVGVFYHISAVSFYNGLGGAINENSDLSLFVQIPGIDSNQLNLLLKSFIEFELGLFYSEMNEELSSKELLNNFLEALYEYPHAKYVQGRYYIELDIDFKKITSVITSRNYFYNFDTSQSTQRLFTFQAFINNRLNAHGSDENIKFITSEEANKILLGCVDGSKFALIAEMRQTLSSEYFSDSIIDVLAGEWIDYEERVLPDMLDLSIVDEGATFNTIIYSQGFKLAVHGLDGWELLVDPQQTLGNLANNIGNTLVYSSKPINASPSVEENRFEYIYQWIQLYFVHKFHVIPKFNKAEIRTILDSIPPTSNPTKSRIRDLILNNKGLILEGTLVEMLSMAFDSYFFYEKFFLVARNIDLTQIFSTPNYGFVQGRLFIPRTIWSFLPAFDNVVEREITDGSINLAEVALGFINRLFFFGESEQRILIDLLNWAIAPDLEDKKVFLSLGLDGSLFVKYIKENTWLKNIKVFMLIPWVDHLLSGFQFRRIKGLISGPISRPIEDIPGVAITGDQKSDGRIKEIISEIERLNLEYKNLLLEFGGQTVSDESAKNLLRDIESTIQSLLTELNSISSDSIGAALLMITEKRLLPPFIFQLKDEELKSIGVVSITEEGEVILDPSKYKIAEGIFNPSLDIGVLDPSNGGIKPYGSSDGMVTPTQIINRLQAFRVWWNSVFPRISFANKDPLLRRDFQSVNRLIGIFNTLGYSEDHKILGVLLWDVTAEHPIRLKDTAFEIIAETFISDERAALMSLSPSAATLEEAYRGTRIIGRFQEFGGTPPQFALISHLDFVPFVPSTKAGAAERDSGTEITHDRVHFLEYLERIVAEYYASSPRNMPTIGIPRLNNLAINFSGDINNLNLLISNIFGEGSPYVSAPSLGASAPGLSNFILNVLPQTDVVDGTYITLHFEDDYIYYGSPIGSITSILKDKEIESELNFSWTILHSIVKENDLFQTGLTRFGDLVEIALNYASEKIGFDIKYERKDLYNISFSYAIGQHFLESARVNFNSILGGINASLRNKLCAIFAKSISVLITYLNELTINRGSISTAHSLFSIVIADSLAGGFFPESVRNEMIQRWSFIFSLNSEFSYSYVPQSKAHLHSISPDVPIFHTSSLFSVAQRQHNQISDLKTLNANLYVTRTSACNILLSAGLFIGRIIESPQNSGRFKSFTPNFLTEHLTWSGYCGISGFEQGYFRPLVTSVFRNLPGFATITSSEKNDLDLILDLFEAKIVEIISSYYDEYDANTPIDVIFGNMNICTLAITSFFDKNVVIVEDLKPVNFTPIKLSDYPNYRHSGLNTLEETSLCRINARGVLEEISLFISPESRASVISSGYSQRNPNRQLKPHDHYFLSKPLSTRELASNFPLETLNSLVEKYSSKIKITVPILTNVCRSGVCSYIRLGDSSNEDSDAVVNKFVEKVSDGYRYVIPGNYLNGRFVHGVNRAVFFLYWWLYTWDKLNFYSNDFFLGSLFSSIEFLSEIFDRVKLSTDISVLFKEFYNRIVGKFKGYSRNDHLRLLLLGFLDSEDKAIEFTGASNIYEAYSDLGMLNAIHAIYLDFKVPTIPKPSGKLVYSNLDEVCSNNLAQYLFRLISEYFAAGPRFYPTTLIPSTFFLGSYFTLEKDNLAYLLYVWSNLESQNSIRGFFEAPSIGASFDSLAAYIIEEAQLKLIDRYADINDFLSPENFYRFFKYGNSLSRIVNLELLDFTCIPGLSSSNTNSAGSLSLDICRPFAFDLSDQSKTNIFSLVKKSFFLALRDSEVPSDSVISIYFSFDQVVSALLKGVNVLDAVRVHGISKYHAQDLNYIQFNKFCLLFSKHFSRILAEFTSSYFFPRNKSSLNLAFSDLKQLSGRSLNALINVILELDNLRVVSTENFIEFLNKFDNDVIQCSIWYESFFGIVVLDQARGLIGIPDIVRKKLGDFLFLHVSTFNYVYSFILFFISVLINKNAKKLKLAFPYMNLLSLENVIRVADYNSRGEALPNSLLRVISTNNKYSLGDLNIQKVNVIYNLFVDNVRKTIGNQAYVAFSSRASLGGFINSLFHASKTVDFSDLSQIGINHQEEDPVKEIIYSIIGPKTQNLFDSRIENELLNDNTLREKFLENHSEYSGIITGSLQKPWVNGFSSINVDELVHVPNDNLSHLDQGNVFLQRQISRLYTLKYNPFLLREEMNSVIELGINVSFPSGVITNSIFAELNGIEVGILNRAVLFREWLIRFWGLNKKIYRDPIILTIINNFSSILIMFETIRYDGVDFFPVSFNTFIYTLTKLVNKDIASEIVTAFCKFEDELLVRTGYLSIRELHETGTCVSLLDNIPIYKDESLLKSCEVKKEVWPTSPFESQAKKNMIEYLTLKLKEYFSARPRSSITFTIPDVSILLDNFSLFKQFNCVIEVWARDRPDLISAPFLGLHPEAIHKYIIEISQHLNYFDSESFSNSKLLYGFLDEEFYFEDIKVSSGNDDISLRQYDSLYVEMIAPILGTPNFKLTIDLLRSLMIIVLDVNGINMYELYGNDKSIFSMKIKSMLDFETFLIRILLGIDQGCAARRLVGGIRFLSRKKANKVSFDFLKRLDVLKECILYDPFNVEFDDIVSRVTLSLRKMGIHLTNGEILSLSSNYFFVSRINVFSSSENLILDCLNLHKFHKRPPIFSTIPEIGLASQLDGTLIDTYFGFFYSPILENYVIDINGLLFILLSLNCIINQQTNKFILNIPASISFAIPGILIRISHCGFVTIESLNCISDTILNSLLEMNIDIGDLSSDILVRILEKVTLTLGELSRGSWPKYDSNITSLDLEKNNKGLVDSPIDFNPSSLNEILGDYSHLKNIVFRTFGLSPILICDILPSFSNKCKEFMSLIVRSKTSKFDLTLLYSLEGYKKKTPFKYNPISYSGFILVSGLNIKKQSPINPLLDSLGYVKDGYLIFKDKFHRISVYIANRAAAFYMFANVSTKPYGGVKGISIDECVKFFSSLTTMDIFESTPHISLFFGKIEFYKVFQLLDAFYITEKIIFSVNDRVPESEYKNTVDLVNVLDQLGHVPLDLEILDGTQKNTFYYGKFICQLARRFFSSTTGIESLPKILKEISDSKCGVIAKHFWPTSEGTNVSPYTKALVILEFIPATRATPRLVSEFVSLHDWFILERIYGSFEGDITDFSRVFEIAFSKPFVCTSEELPWLLPNYSFNGISFHEFNFINFIKVSWNEFSRKHSLNAADPSDVQLIKILEAYNRNFPISRSGVFDELLSEARSRSGFTEYNKKNNPNLQLTEADKTLLEKDFFETLQRFWRVRHSGVIRVSFRWPYIDCDSDNKPFVPGLSFPLTVNSKKKRNHGKIEITHIGEIIDLE